MTINELESKLQKLDPNLEIVRDRYMKSEVLVIKPDLLAVKGQYFIYDFSNKRFIRNGLLEWFNNNDTFAFDKMQSLLNKYLYGSNDYQTISKEKNGSTMTFEDDISNDSQKKPVLRGLYTKKENDSILEKYKKKQEDIESEMKELGLESKEKIKRHFIDYLLDNYFNPRIQTMLGETTKIEILDPTLTLICTIDFSKEEPVSLNISGTKDADFLKMLIGLSANILQMIKDLDYFKKLNQLKEDGDGK